MKKAKKALAFVLVLAITIAGTIGATIAYLTDTDDATNTFTIGNVEIVLDEAAVKEGENDEGFFSYVEDAEKDRVKSNRYENLIPGSTICKDPTVKNVGSQPAYIRVTLKHNNNDAIFTYFENDEFLQSVVGLSDTMLKATQIDVAWKLADGTYGENATNVADLEDTLKADEKVYVFYFTEALNPSDAITLFTEINVPKSFTGTEMAAFKDLVIDIHADAIQTGGFENVMEAFAAFDAQMAS